MAKYDIVNLRATVTTAEPGILAYDAEAELEVNGETLYAHMNDAGEGRMYTIAKSSWYDYMTGTGPLPDDDPKFLEEYEYENGEDFEDEETDYGDVFALLRTMVEALQG